jgi:hypothetical protein
MTTQVIRELEADAARGVAWDRFLDAYSAYLKEPSLFASAALRLEADRLGSTDKSFSAREFLSRVRRSYM